MARVERDESVIYEAIEEGQHYGVGHGATSSYQNSIAADRAEYYQEEKVKDQNLHKKVEKKRPTYYIKVRIMLIQHCF